MNAHPVHIVIVAYHSSEQLARCLAGLERELPVTVVDNSSSKEVAAVAQCHGSAYVDSGANRGFAAGVNVALARVTGENVDVLLLNPDAVVTPDAVRTLEEFLHRPENARVAAVSPRLVDSAGANQRLVWPFPTPGRMWAEAVGLGRLPPRQTFVVGAVLLLRREALDDIGFFDERFFLYAEETDWQRRAQKSGWSSVVCFEAIAEHAGAGTSISMRQREVRFHEAHETYIRKWYGVTGWWFYRVAACFGAALRTLVLSGERRKEAARRTLLYLRGPRRCAALESD